MSKPLKYTIRFTVWALVILLAHLVATFTVWYLPLEKLKLVYGVIALIFALGAVIIAPGLSKDPEKFAIRFLLLTTVQMLAVFGFIGFLAFSEMKGVRNIGFHTIALFIGLLFTQSYHLIRINSGK